MSKNNLMPIQEVNSNRTREQHSADSRRAGIASGEARRRKRDLKQAIEIMLSLDVKDKKARKLLESLGFDPEEMDNQMALAVSMMNQAVSKGNVQAAIFLRDTVGDKPVEKVQNNVNANINNPFNGLTTEELKEMIKNDK